MHIFLAYQRGLARSSIITALMSVTSIIVEQNVGKPKLADISEKAGDG